MYEILSAIILALICYVIYKQAKDIETIVQSNTEFYTAYAEYVKAVAEHNKIVHECLGKLDSSYEKSYYAVTALAAHTEYLEGIVHSLEEKVLKDCKGEQNGI